MKETELFEPVKNFFEQQGYEIYTEVDIGSRPDIIAVRDGKITVIELKTSFSIQLIEQAYDWTRGTLIPHYVYIAVPHTIKKSYFRERICKEHGIGILYVYVKHYVKDIRIKNQAKLLRYANKHSKYREWDKYLLDEFRYKYNGAGGRQGAYKTRWNIMLEHVVRDMSWSNKRKMKEWFTIQELIEIPQVQYHYCNPKSSLYSSMNSLSKQGLLFEKSIINNRVHFKLKSTYREDLEFLCGMGA